MSTELFLGLMTRCRNDGVIVEFCQYYLSQGVDKIYIVDDASTDKTIYDPILNDERVHITWKETHETQDKLNIIYFDLYKRIKTNFKWMIVCDVDEFITTKRNSDNTIRDELSTTFADVDCIKIPWVMMAFNNIQHTPKSILKTNTWRRNQDIKHPVNHGNEKKFRCRYHKMEVKCIFRTKMFRAIERHHPLQCTQADHRVVNHQNQQSKLSPHVHNFRETDIKTGYLLCYHYRIYSLDHAMLKHTTSSFPAYKKVYDRIISNDYAEIEDFTMVNKLP